MRVPDLAAYITQQGSNVLVPDTCTLLDVVRGPIRGNMDIVKTALQMVDKVHEEALPFIVVLSSLFESEWQEHVAEVREQVTLELRKYLNWSRTWDSLHQLTRKTPLSVTDVTLLGFESDLEDACRRIMAHAITMQAEDNVKIAAMNRVTTVRAPASKGKSEPKDCFIFEEVLALGRELRRKGFRGRIVFASSNTNDYRSAGELRPDIETDLQSIKGEFAVSLSHGYHLAALPSTLLP